MAVAAGSIAVETILPAGGRLLDALATTLEAQALASACLTLSGGAFGPFAYVIPGLSPDGSQAAFYSAPFRPAGVSRLDVAAVTVGFRDARPFFHCHAAWTEQDGRRGCGHMLPEETVIAAPITARGAGLVGARFEVKPDPETRFSLFVPVATGRPPPPAAASAVALRLAPNQDLTHTLEAVCRTAGFSGATVQGGVASTIGARFADAPPIEAFATELLVRRGVIAPDADSVLDIVIVDLDGAIGAGRLVAGENPVLMTFEGVLQAL